MDASLRRVVCLMHAYGKWLAGSSQKSLTPKSDPVSWDEKLQAPFVDEARWLWFSLTFGPDRSMLDIYRIGHYCQ